MEGISLEELQLAARNHGMPLEALRYAVTPVGLHYLLTHYDVPAVEPDDWRLVVSGERELSLGLAELRERPRAELAVDDGVRGERPRAARAAAGQPAVAARGGRHGSLGRNAAARRCWTRWASRTARSRCSSPGSTAASRAESSRPSSARCRSRRRSATSVLLAYEMNGEPLPPQHGFPLRLVVPGWYGMTNVKWLERIEFLDEPFGGYQQAQSYRVRQSEDEEGEPLSRMRPRSLFVPPGIPEFLTRERTVAAGEVVLEGRAWSGFAPIASVEVSADGGATWAAAELEPAGRAVGLARLDATPGRRSRATTSSAHARATRPGTSSRSTRRGTSAVTRTTPSSVSR